MSIVNRKMRQGQAPDLWSLLGLIAVVGAFVEAWIILMMYITIVD